MRDSVNLEDKKFPTTMGGLTYLTFSTIKIGMFMTSSHILLLITHSEENFPPYFFFSSLTYCSPKWCHSETFSSATPNHFSSVLNIKRSETGLVTYWTLYQRLLIFCLWLYFKNIDFPNSGINIIFCFLFPWLSILTKLRIIASAYRMIIDKNKACDLFSIIQMLSFNRNNLRVTFKVSRLKVGNL